MGKKIFAEWLQFFHFNLELTRVVFLCAINLVKCIIGWHYNHYAFWWYLKIDVKKGTIFLKIGEN